MLKGFQLNKGKDLPFTTSVSQKFPHPEGILEEKVPGCLLRASSIGELSPFGAGFPLDYVCIMGQKKGAKKMAVVETRHALVHGIREIHLGKVFRLVQEDLTLPNGFRTSLEVVRHPGASAIVALSGNGEVLLLHQYRHAVGEFIWEIPAGTLKDKEEPLECAKRELMEETGYEAMELKELGQMVPVPGYSDERIHIFLATGLRPANQNLDRDEVIAVHSVPFHRSFEMIRKGEIKDAKTIVGLTLAKMALAE